MYNEGERGTGNLMTDNLAGEKEMHMRRWGNHLITVNPNIFIERVGRPCVHTDYRHAPDSHLQTLELNKITITSLPFVYTPKPKEVAHLRYRTAHVGNAAPW